MDDRKKQRVMLEKEIIINNIIKGHILDISEGGMYVHTQAEFIPKSVLDLKFSLCDKQVTVKGAVQHVEEGVGIGIKFINLSVEDYTCIKGVLHNGSQVKAKETGAKKILIVDDHEQSRTMYRTKLISEGYSTTEALNGTEAFKKLQETRFDLVILEVWVEGLDGFKILQIMKINPLMKDIPVLILSARSTPADSQKAITLGARDYLVKMTTTPAKLAEKVKSILTS
jgi:CheY-like chemotaxis protein